MKNKTISEKPFIVYIKATLNPKISKSICKALGDIYTIKTGITSTPVSGHNFIEIENNNIKQVLRCTRCGKESIGWK